jgi:hypothetical protein
MRRVSLLLAVLALTGLSTGVVGGPDAEEGEMTIMNSGGSSSASQAVGPNGTEWRTQISNLENACISGNQTQGVDFGNFSQIEANGENMTEITFSGVVETSNPCHRIELNVSDSGNESGDAYVVEFVEKSTGGVCTQCMGYVKFEGSFAAPGDYRVTFENDGEELENRTTPGYGEGSDESGSTDEASVAEGFSMIWKWLGSLF